MKKLPFALLFSAVSLFSFGEPVAQPQAEWPFAILRCYGSYGRNRRFMDRVFRAVREHPGLINEIWFGGSLAFAAPDAVRKYQEDFNLGARQICRDLGIAYSFQQGVTLNHDPDYKPHARFTDEAWAMNRAGQRLRGLFCCTSPEAKRQARDTAKAILSVLQPDSYWPDDDLRITKVNWQHPEICWCPRCLDLFGRKTGETWTRQTLLVALEGPRARADIRRAWCQFNGEMLGEYAREYRAAVDEVSPRTRLGIQAAFTVSALEGDAAREVLRAFSGKNRERVGIRPGYGYYDDQQPRKAIEKMLHVAREAEMARQLPQVAQVCYECENWPHIGALKNPQGQMAECALALANGCDSLALYWGADQNGEDEASYDFWLKAVGESRPFHLTERQAFAGTRLGGVAAYVGEDRFAGKDWLDLFSADLMRLAGNGLPVGVQEGVPDVWLVNARTVRTLTTNELKTVFAQATLMDPQTLGNLAKKFPTLAFPKKVRLSSLPKESALATDLRVAGYERFPDGRLSDKLQSLVYPQSADVVRFSEMTADPKACGTCAIPTEFGGTVVIAQDTNGLAPHLVWPGARRHAILDALDAAVPGKMPSRILTDGYSLSVTVRKNAAGRTAGVLVMNLGTGETPPLELAVRKGASATWRVSHLRKPDSLATVVRRAADETVLRLAPLEPFGVALVSPAK